MGKVDISGELGKVQEELEETLRLSDAKDDELEKLREEVGVVAKQPISLFVVLCFLRQHTKGMAGLVSLGATPRPP